MKNEKTYLRDGRAPIPTKEITSKIMSNIKAKNTKPEIALRSALYSHDIKGYRLHWSKVPGRPDIAFTRKKIAVFVNGCFWHRCPYCQLSLPKSHSTFWKEKFERNVARDAKKTEHLNQIGWQVIVLWECEIDSNVKKCVSVIKKIIAKAK